MIKPYTYVVTDYRVIDGDTIAVTLDLGFHLRHDIHIRLRGINTPEVRGFEKIAGIPVRELVRDIMILDREGDLLCSVSELGKFAGRAIGDFSFKTTSGLDIESLSQYLIERKLGVVYGGSAKKPFSSEDLKLIIEAVEITRKEAQEIYKANKKPAINAARKSVTKWRRTPLCI